MNHLNEVTSEELFHIHKIDKKGESLSDFVVPFVIERIPEMLMTDIRELMVLSLNVGTTGKLQIRHLKKLKMRIQEIVQISKIEDRFL